jgi:hypothetical protein
MVYDSPITTTGDFTFTTGAGLGIFNTAASNISLSGATITWNTNLPANSAVQYGTSMAYGSSASASALTTTHSITLTGLSANTVYHYRVASTDANGDSANSVDGTFVTVAAGTAQITVTVSGTSYQLNLNQDSPITFVQNPPTFEDWLLGVTVQVSDTGGGTIYNTQITSASYDGYSAIVPYYPPAGLGLYYEWENVSTAFPVPLGSISAGTAATANLLFYCNASNVPISSPTLPPYPFPSGQAHTFTLSGLYYNANNVIQTFSISLRSLAAPLY